MATLLPPNATPLMRELAAADAAIEGVNVAVVATMADPANCPLAVLPFIAWALSVDTWSEAWSEAEKRAVVRDSLAMHAHKGTRAGMDTAVAASGGGLLVEEWWQQDPPGQPNTFTLRITPGGVARAPDWYRALFATLDAAKPLRDHYAVLIDQLATGNVEIGVIASAAVFAHFDTTATRAA